MKNSRKAKNSDFIAKFVEKLFIFFRSVSSYIEILREDSDFFDETEF